MPVGRPSGRTHDARWPAKASTFFGSDWFAVAQPATPSTGQSHGLGMHDAGCNTQHIVIDQQTKLIAHWTLPTRAELSLFVSVHVSREVADAAAHRTTRRLRSLPNLALALTLTLATHDADGGALESCVAVNRVFG